jgi:carbon starvation protein
MLLEGLIAVISLACVMMLAKGDQSLGSGPDAIFAAGIARFAGVLGVPVEVGYAFGLLALTTFIYDTLDVCTRLGRYILQELLGLGTERGRILATVLTLAPPLVFLALSPPDAFKRVWAAFGTSNQLLAALTLLGVSVWMRAEGRRHGFILVPALFLLAVTGWSLGWSVLNFGSNPLIGSISAVLLLLAGTLTVECALAWRRAGAAPAPSPA